MLSFCRSLISLVVVVLLAVFARPVPAQTVSFAGFTSGCFGLTCTPPSANVFQSATLGGLTYQNSTFGGSTLAGFAAVGNNAAGLGIRSVDNLGAFYLTSVPFTYTGAIFNLAVSFTQPGVATPLYAAVLHGAVSSKAGGVFIDFNNALQTFSYNNGTTSGTFSFEVNDVSIIAPAAGAMTSIGASGNLWATAVTTPEPASFGLLATGFLGLVVARRRLRGG